MHRDISNFTRYAILNTQTGTNIVYWFQYTNALYRDEYCTTSNRLTLSGFTSYMFVFLHNINIEMNIASNAYICTCKYLFRLHFIINVIFNTHKKIRILYLCIENYMI